MFTKTSKEYWSSVMGRDSHSKGRGFESQHRILDGQFFTYTCCKHCNDVCLKRPEINEQEAGLAHFYKTSKEDLQVTRIRKLDEIWIEQRQRETEQKLYFELLT